MYRRRSLSAGRARVGLLALTLFPGLLLVSGPAHGADLPNGKPQVQARPSDPDASAAEIRAHLLRAALAQFGTRHPAERAVVLAHVAAWGRTGGDELLADFWLDRRRTAAAAAAQLIGVADPIAVAALRVHGKRMLFWPEPAVESAPDLNPSWLASVRDEKPFLDLRARAPDELQSPRLRPGYDEYLAYCQAVVAAAHAPRDAFAKSAAENGSLNFGHLYREPDRHRGKVVHLEGRLRRVTREDAPKEAQRRGVRAIYEGWIFLDRPGLPPVCVIFPDLPPNIKEGDKVDRRVAFDGYFFKKYRYPSGKKDERGRNVPVTTLLFIGPTVIPEQSPPPQSAARSVLPRPVLYAVIGFVALTVALLVGVNLWYRRTDRQVRSRLEALQSERLAERAPGTAEEGGFPLTDEPWSERTTERGSNGPAPPGHS